MSSLNLGRRGFLKLTGAVGVSALLTACEVAPPAAEDGTGMEVMQLEYQGYELDEAHAAAFGRFKEVEPDVDLLISPVQGSWPDMLAQVNARIAAGDPPDIAIVATYGLPRTWSRRGILLDLQPFVDADGDFDGDPIPPSLLASYRLEGALFGMPKDYVSHAFIYNRAIFDERGVPYPEAGWTWADCLSRAQALTYGQGREKVFGLGSNSRPWDTEHWLWANEGPGLFDRWHGDLTTPTASDDRNKEALQWLLDTVLVHEVSPSQAQLAAEGAGSRQVSGRLAMWMGHTLHTVLLRENQDRLDWHVAPNPVAVEGGPSTSMLWTSGFGVVDGTEHPDRAFAFLKHMSIGSGALVLGETGFSIPAGRPEGFLTDDMVARGGQIFLDAAFESTLAANDSLGTNHSELLGTAVTPHYEAAFRGQMDASDALDTIQAQMEAILAGAGEEQY